MNIIFLSPPDLKKPLALEPKEDTLYCLPEEIGENTLSLHLSVPGVQALIVGLFRTKEKQHLTIHQHHTAPHTTSHVFLKTILNDSASFSYEGNLHVAKEARGAVASQEARGLLMGDHARFKAIPSLEILPEDVRCTHKASAAPLSQDSLFTLATRGLSPSEAKTLLESAFLRSAFETLAQFGVRAKELAIIQEHYQ